MIHNDIGMGIICSWSVFEIFAEKETILGYNIIEILINENPNDILL